MDFNELVGGSGSPGTPMDMRSEKEMYLNQGLGMMNAALRERTFKERLADKIAYHQSEINKLKTIQDSMSPDIEKFVEALSSVRL